MPPFSLAPAKSRFPYSARMPPSSPLVSPHGGSQASDGGPDPNEGKNGVGDEKQEGQGTTGGTLLLGLVLDPDPASCPGFRGRALLIQDRLHQALHRRGLVCTHSAQ